MSEFSCGSNLISLYLTREQYMAKKTGPEPFQWTEELIEYLCDELASGLSILQVAGKNGLPAAKVIYRAMYRDETFYERVSRAREIQQEAAIDECDEIAKRATNATWSVARLQIQTKQWAAAKRNQRRFGDRSPVAAEIAPVMPSKPVDAPTVEEAMRLYQEEL